MPLVAFKGDLVRGHPVVDQLRGDHFRRGAIRRRPLERSCRLTRIDVGIDLTKMLFGKLVDRLFGELVQSHRLDVGQMFFGGLVLPCQEGLAVDCLPF